MCLGVSVKLLQSTSKCKPKTSQQVTKCQSVSQAPVLNSSAQIIWKHCKLPPESQKLYWRQPPHSKIYHIDSLQCNAEYIHCLEIMVDPHLWQKLTINAANYPPSHSVSLASVANSLQDRVQIKECLNCELWKFAMHLSFSAKYVCAISFHIGEKTINFNTESFQKTTLFDNYSFQQLSLFKTNW